MTNRIAVSQKSTPLLSKNRRRSSSFYLPADCAHWVQCCSHNTFGLCKQKYDRSFLHTPVRREIRSQLVTQVTCGGTKVRCEPCSQSCPLVIGSASKHGDTRSEEPLGLLLLTKCAVGLTPMKHDIQYNPVCAVTLMTTLLSLFLLIGFWGCYG